MLIAKIHSKKISMPLTWPTLTIHSGKMLDPDQSVLASATKQNQACLLKEPHMLILQSKEVLDPDQTALASPKLAGNCRMAD